MEDYQQWRHIAGAGRREKREWNTNMDG